MFFFRILLQIAGSTVIFVNMATAQSLPAPQGDVILTVSGRIAVTNIGNTAQFDRDMLEKLGQAEITTVTPWFDGESTFTGTPLSTLLQAVGAEGETIKAIALNDYETDVPLTDAWDSDVILATKLNGEIMTVRDKGPIFIIYPYSSSVRFQTQTYYARSAWQVMKLVIR